ncbi:Hypothetical protein CINCED_3A006305 [Cinara cedri]|uniref:Uncharacterized protein n=1 Tax=Cinara cedri TaxID=506608 RepID=A0A5E4MNY0_9HEMI|nr:Hypothetical protein CINCED_3A006305 [Cinara cedri]
MGTPVNQINRGRASREDSVLDTPPTTGNQTPSKYAASDVVYYKTHKKLHAEFAPIWWEHVNLEKQICKGVLNDQQPKNTRVKSQSISHTKIETSQPTKPPSQIETCNHEYPSSRIIVPSFSHYGQPITTTIADSSKI